MNLISADEWMKKKKKPQEKSSGTMKLVPPTEWVRQNRTFQTGTPAEVVRERLQQENINPAMMAPQNSYIPNSQPNTEAPLHPAVLREPTATDRKGTFADRVQNSDFSQAVDKVFQDNPVARVIQRPFAKAAELLTPDAPMIGSHGNIPGTNARDLQREINPVQSTGNKTVDKVLDVAAIPISFGVNPAQVEQGLIGAGYKAANGALASKVGQAVERSAGNVAGKAAAALTRRTGVNIPADIAAKASQQAVRGAIAGGVTGLGYGLETTDGDPKELATETTLGAITGGAGDAAGPVAKALLQKVAGTKIGKGLAEFIKRNYSVNPEQNKQVQELLALPAPKPKALREGTAPSGNPIAAPGEVHPYALPEGNIAPIYQQAAKGPIKVNRATRLNQVMERIKPIVEERLTPPLENPNELAKWVQPHLGSDISLNELRKLSYDDLTELANEIRTHTSVYDTAVQVAKEKGYNLPFLLEGSQPAPKLNELKQNSAYGIYPNARSNAKLVHPAGKVIENEALRPMANKFVPANGQRTPLEPVQAKPPILQSTPKKQPQVERIQSQPVVNKQAPADVNDPFKGIDDSPSNIDYPFEFDGPQEIKYPKFDDMPDVLEESPRIRDKVGAQADKLIQDALQTIRSTGGRLNSNPVDVYAKYTESLVKMGTGLMLKGAVRFADWSEMMIRELGEAVRPHLKDIWRQSKAEYANLKPQIERKELGLDQIVPEKLKDTANIRQVMSDVYRNFRNVFGEQFPAIKKAVLDPFDQAKADFVKEQEKYLKDMHNEIVKKLGIRKGSKLSAAVQKFGEGEMSLLQLQSAFPDKWEDVVAADRWFRRAYDNLLDRVNRTVAKIYPTNPDKIVPRRNDYYRHFRDLNGLQGIRNIFETPAMIDPRLSGISPFTTPKSKWASFKQQRGIGEFKNDAVGGFLDYLPAAAYAIHIDPQIGVFRNLAKQLADQTAKIGNINNFIKFLHNFANDLAGKTSPFDRWIDEIGGRRALRIIKQLNNRVKANIVLGNVKSALSQMANIPQGIAFAKQYSVPGATRTLMSLVEPNAAMQQSNFLKERYLGKEFRKFDTRWIEQPKKFAGWLMEATDRIGTSFIWNSAYAKAAAKGIENPAKFADEETRRLVAGRGVGEVPLLQKSSVFQLAAPFQLEVGNLWHVMKDFVKAKDFGGIALLFLSSWLLNNAYEKVTGNRVVFDPIDAFIQAFSEPDLTPAERVGRIGGEVLSNVPLGQSAAAAYPEYGFKMGNVQLPTRQELFGSKDPTRFGEGLLVMKGIQDPIYKMILPFGGNQLKKTIQGTESIARGASYTPNGQMRFPLQGKVSEDAQAILFGPYGTSSAQEYFDKNRRPLSAGQTAAVERSQAPIQTYETIQRNRRLETLRESITKTLNDLTLSPGQKRRRIEMLRKQIEKELQQK